MSQLEHPNHTDAWLVISADVYFTPALRPIQHRRLAYSTEAQSVAEIRGRSSPRRLFR
jgi:hypothetical protein